MITEMKNIYVNWLQYAVLRFSMLFKSNIFQSSALVSYQLGEQK